MGLLVSKLHILILTSKHGWSHIFLQNIHSCLEHQSTLRFSDMAHVLSIRVSKSAWVSFACNEAEKKTGQKFCNVVWIRWADMGKTQLNRHLLCGSLHRLTINHILPQLQLSTRYQLLVWIEWKQTRRFSEILDPCDSCSSCWTTKVTRMIIFEVVFE